jgi:hypothetical protein
MSLHRIGAVALNRAGRNSCLGEGFISPFGPTAHANKLPIEHLTCRSMIVTIALHTDEILVLMVIDASMVNDFTAFLMVCASCFLVEQAAATSAASRVGGVPVHGKFEIHWIMAPTIVNIRMARVTN